MSNSMQQPPSAPPRKGLPVIAWIGIGCGGLLILLITALIMFGIFAYRVGKEFAENPALAQAKLMALAHPNLEVVSEDKDKGIITLRDKTTGETFTLDSSKGFEEGIMHFVDSEGNEVILDEKGQMIITNEEGTTSIRNEGDSVVLTGPEGEETIVGAAAEQRIPQWVPRYRGATYVHGSISVKGNSTAGNMILNTADSVDRSAGYFESELNETGYEVNARRDQNMSTIEAKRTNPDRSIMVMVMPAVSGSQISITFQENR